MKTFIQSIVFCTLICAFTTIGLGQKMKAEDVIAKHLDSIGTAEARSAAKTYIAVGTGTAQFKSTKDQVLQGRIVFASAGINNFLGMNMNSNFYTGETFAYHGSDSYIGFVNLSARSVLGNFVQSNNTILSDGLFAGTLSTSWALTRLAQSKAKVSFDGLKKIDGKELYALGYSRKNGGDIEVVMFFDKETFRHVRTEYKRVSSAAIGLRPEDSSKFSETRYKVVEDFADFKAEGGLMLPHGYRIFYSTTGGQGTTDIEWNFVISEFAANQKLDPSTFAAPSKK